MLTLVLLIVGILLIRLLAKILEYANPLVRAIISTVIAALVGLWAKNVDLNVLIESGDELSSLIDGLVFVPALLGVGTALMAVTLGWESDSGYWNEYYRTEKYSYGRTEGDLGLLGQILWAVIIATPIYFVLWAFSIYPIEIYYIFHGILLVKVLIRVLKKD